VNLFYRESRTKNIMIRMYCWDHHNPEGELCPDCDDLRRYSDERLVKYAPSEKLSQPVANVASIVTNQFIAKKSERSCAMPVLE